MKYKEHNFTRTSKEPDIKTTSTLQSYRTHSIIRKHSFHIELSGTRHIQDSGNSSLSCNQHFLLEHTHTNKNTHTSTHTHWHTHTSTHTHTGTLTHTHTHKQLRGLICIHTHTHTHIHIYRERERERQIYTMFSKQLPGPKITCNKIEKKFMYRQYCSHPQSAQPRKKKFYVPTLFQQSTS